jgi:transposase
LHARQPDEPGQARSDHRGSQQYEQGGVASCDRAIVLATADGLGTAAIMRATAKSKPCVWRWQERYVAEGVEGLPRDKTRPPGAAPLSDAIKHKVLVKTATETPVDATQWSVRSMAAEIGISHTSVQRIWREAGLKPHLVRTFKISNDPHFEEKVTDVVGLYMNPPEKALVLCVMPEACFQHDEKTQVQALDRTQPGLPQSGDRRLSAAPQRQPKPFVWTKSAFVILEKERRTLDLLDRIKAGYEVSESEH